MQFSAQRQEAPMSRFTRQLLVVAVALAAFAPAAGAAVYQHSPGLAQSRTVATPFAHSAGVNPYSHVLAVMDAQLAPTVSAAPSSSFDWADAGIGAGALATLLVLLGATTIAVRRNGGRRVAV
jgi:hypothetical protein